jgi:hypothetical protein
MVVFAVTNKNISTEEKTKDYLPKNSCPQNTAYP